MDTRSSLPDDPASDGKRCVYCAGTADSKDHAPPKALLQRPFPSHLITLPACVRCNNGFSFDENVVRSLLECVGRHPDLVAARQPEGRLIRACERQKKLRDILDRSFQPDGNYGLTEEILESVNRIIIKTVQGLFFGLYERVVPKESLKILEVADYRHVDLEQTIMNLRPSPLKDITDKPFSEISPNSWHSREPVFIMDLQPIDGGPPIKRVFRLTRDTPVEWIDFQPGIFTFTFVKREESRAACILNLWETMVIVVETPWPDSRGPLRKGKKNRMSRDR